MLVSCVARFIHSVAEKRWAIFSLCSMRKGAINIDRTIAANTGCMVALSTMFRELDSARRTNPNSPPWARLRPVRIATPESDLNRRERAEINKAFIPIKAMSSSITHKKLSDTDCISRSMPIVTKNRPSNISRNGLMSSST